MRCNEAMHHFAVAISHGNPALLNENTRRHLSECPLCRAGILFTLRASNLAPRPAPASCDECQADLPAFIDLEQRDPAAAPQTYPGVWWHLWTCPDCSDIYAITRALLDAREPCHWAMHQPGESQQVGWLLPICIAHSDVLLLLPKPSNTRLTVRGPDRRHALFDEPIDTAALHQCTVWATQLDDESYQIDVESTEPLRCAVELRCGDMWLRADFDAEGWASLGALPARLLTEAEGPDLNLVFVDPKSEN